jgi:hypothetical protein
MQPGRFFGNTTSKDVAGVVLSEVVHPESRSLPEHSHQWPYLSMLLQGFYRETIGDETISYDPFTAVFHGSGLVHSDEIGDGGARFFIVELNDAWQETIERHGGAPQHAYELHGDGASWVALRLYHDFVLDTASEESAEEALLELCAYLPEAPPPDTSRPAWLDAVVGSLLKTFRETYSLRRLASDVGVDPSHLARNFLSIPSSHDQRLCLAASRSRSVSPDRRTRSCTFRHRANERILRSKPHDARDPTPRW